MAQDAGWGGGAYGGGPYGGGPYGGPPGWGGWVPPPRPGVIPLAPLRLGDLLGGAFSTMGRYAKQVFGLAGALYGGAAAVMALAVAVAYSSVGDSLERLIALSYDEEPATGDITALIAAGSTLALLGGVMMLVVSGLMYAAVPAVAQEAVLGRAISFGAVWRRAWGALLPVMGALFLTALVMLVPVVLLMVAFLGAVVLAISYDGGAGSGTVAAIGVLGALATAPLAVWLWIKFSLAPAVVVFERGGPVTALRRSSQLVRGDWWRIFGITLLVYAMAGVAGYVVQLPFMILGIFPGVIGGASLDSDPSPAAVLAMAGGYVVAMTLGQLVSQIVSTTFPQLVTALLYVDRRMRAENLGPVLAEAAGTPYPEAAPPYGNPRWGDGPPPPYGPYGGAHR
ncbi:hypothetical protein GA0115241_104054 [Streptomyces sp. DpondAA-D4]|nr:hypothetical protein YUMDRAFT_02368 [Streptomyces sp. OspMP-M45]SCD56068.1 hypothetical protein GA0115241_104054 [Streptomyces sp. DpondAA-D4]